MEKTSGTEKRLSAIITTIGIVVMACWFINQSWLLYYNPNNIFISFNTALCFALLGGAMLVPDSRAVLRRKAAFLVGWSVILFSALVLSQDIYGKDLGLDQLFVKVTIDDYNPHAGRMAPPTSLSFMLCGWVLMLLGGTRRHGRNIAIQSSVLVVMMLSVLGIAGAYIRLELLYDWYRYSRMSLPTAITFLLLAVDLWVTWYAQESRDGVYLEREDRRIGVTGVLIITVVALSAGMSGFGILANQMEQTLELSLKAEQTNHVQLIGSEIDLGVSGAFPVTTRLLLNRYLAVFNVNPQATEAREIIRQDAESFLGHNFSAIAIYARSGELVTQIGQFAESPSLDAPLKVDSPASHVDLLWKNGAMLRVKMDITANGETIGTALVERKLPYMDKLLSEKNLLGETAEIRICYALSASDMQCLPSNHHPEVFPREPRVRPQDITSMHYALMNRTGIRIFRDYLDHQTVSAFGPVGTYGLGMVVKIDTAEFYGPIRQRLEYAFALVLLLSAIGIFVQNIQLVPLVKRLVESEERVKTVNRLQQALLDSANLTIIGCDARGIITVFNKSAERMLGYSAEEVIGKMTPEIFHDTEEVKNRAHELSEELGCEVKPGMDAFTAKAAVKGHDEHEWSYIRRDGTCYPVLLSVSSIRNEAGELAGSMGIGVDISERKRLETMKNEFISTVSHELRTPLTSIRGSLGLMRSGVVGEMPPKAREMTEIAYNNAERLILLINDILDIDKIESGEMRFDMKEYDLGAMVAQAIEAIRPYGEKFGVHFVTLPFASPMLVAVDVNRFMQVLSNLLSNAAKFSDAGDEVVIAIRRTSGKIRISVTDKGPGIPEEFHPRIFRKFAQADSSSSRQKGGTGLGLNISKQIVEHMKGEIGFTSKVNEGSTFWIELPEIKARPTSEEIHEAIEYLNADNRNFLPRILHAEDDYGLCRIIMHSLQDKAVVHVAATVSDASKLLASNRYDLLILDLSLPDGTGLRLLRQIKRDNLPMKVMILSASEVDDNVRQSVELALVKSTISEEKTIEHILALVAKDHPVIPKDPRRHVT